MLQGLDSTSSTSLVEMRARYTCNLFRYQFNCAHKVLYLHNNDGSSTIS